MDTVEDVVVEAIPLFIYVENFCPYPELRVSHKVSELLNISPHQLLSYLIVLGQYITMNPVITPTVAINFLATLKFMQENQGRTPSTTQEAQTLEQRWPIPKR